MDRVQPIGVFHEGGVGCVEMAQARKRTTLDRGRSDHRDGEPSKHRLGHAQQVGQQEGQDAAKMLTLRSAGPDQADGSGRPDGVLPAWFRR
jgi:hypothetical protein